jgi:HSP20 family molecular chaperone IbpA
LSPQTATALQTAKGPAPIKQSAAGDVFDRIQQTYDEIARRAFEIFSNNGRWLGSDLEDWLRAESELLHPIHLEIAESDSELIIRAEVPGFSSKELEINLEPRRLMITGKHQSLEENNKAKTIYSERCAKEILRVVDLPMEVDSSKVRATLKNGILNIELPKAARAKIVRIEPSTA